MAPIGIRAQMFVLALLCGLPGALGLGFYAINDWSSATDTARVRSHAVAKRVASELEREFKEYDYLLGQLAKRPLVRALNGATCDPLVVEYTSLHAELTAITVRDLESKLICSSLANATPVHSRQEAALAAQGALSGGFKVVSVTRGEVSGRLVARMVYPVRDAQGQIKGELLAPLDLRISAQRFLSGLSDNIAVAVVDADGNILMSSPSANAWDGQPVPPGLWKSGDRREAFVSASDASGVARIGAYVAIPTTRWTVAASMAEADTLWPHRVAMTLAGLGAICCFAVALAGAWFIAGNVGMPIDRLRTTVERYTSGNSSARAQEAGPREVRALVRIINALLDRVSAPGGRQQ